MPNCSRTQLGRSDGRCVPEQSHVHATAPSTSASGTDGIANPGRPTRLRACSSRALFDLVKTQGRDGAAGIVQGEKALSRIESHHDAAGGRDPYTEADSAPRPFLPSEREETEGVAP